jgi:hypothetical protein
MSSTDAWHYALAAFLILTGLTAGYALIRLGILLTTVDKDLDKTMDEVLPMLGKASVTLDHVNDELEKVGHITESAVDAVDAVDHVARTASSAASKPVRVLSGVTSGIEHAFESLRNKRGQRGGVV